MIKESRHRDKLVLTCREIVFNIKNIINKNMVDFWPIKLEEVIMRKSVVFLVFAILIAMLSGCIVSKKPSSDIVYMEIGEKMTFSVNVFPSTETCTWKLDWVPQTNTGTSYDYTAQPGVHSLTVQTKENDKGWTIIVSQPFKAVSAGAQHTVAIKTDGSLWAWGWNYNGQLGDGTNGNEADKNVPTKIGTGTDWSVVSAGAQHTVAIKTDGSLWAWGYNAHGQLGDGTNIDRNVPKQIGTDTNWTVVSAGGEHTVAIKRDGSLWAWGVNSYGQLGDGTNGWLKDKNIPTKISDAKDWNVVSAGYAHTMAIKTDGSLWAWGWNCNGQLGDGTYTDKNVPTLIGTDTTWAVVSAGHFHTVAIKANKTLWAWGLNDNGQLGDGTNTDKNIPTRIGTGINWDNVSAGHFHNVAIKANKTLWAWGKNEFGQLGDGTYGIGVYKNIPAQIGSENNWTVVSAGAEHIVALNTNKELWACGLNGNGQLGDGKNADKNTLTQVP